ncbi:type II toxin-antitoxin system PemK/MazF family toxin [Dyadobacter arcticus]|uniref:mRNA interferase MazF n=1 Tax=Dyadobacter arcticus TaxID=1078754 RepID=A0ABX0UF49_9BACT|nr:type II toxin-antitoxin system PemK/MazF family toxin [Dyadobacter arcticus]NIJ51616.1 mRNA interferase MazF [Dyadobacter arcticus]
MGKFIKGEIVVIPFPFSDLSGSKKRPALVLADLEGDDILLCQITSQSGKDFRAVSLISSDFESGSLPIDSFIRPARIFTADKGIIIRKAGLVRDKVIDNVTKKIIDLLK